MDTQEPMKEQGPKLDDAVKNATSENNSESLGNLKEIALKFFMANIKTIVIAVLVIIILSRMFAPSVPPVTQQVDENKTEDLIQKSEEMEKSQKLTALPALQDDFKMAIDLLKDLFAKHGFETSVFRLTDVYDYYVTPAQEANGLRDPKRLAIRFAVRRKGDTEWKDCSHMKNADINIFVWHLGKGEYKQYANDILVDIVTWDGKRSGRIISDSSREQLEKSLLFHKEKGFQ